MKLYLILLSFIPFSYTNANIQDEIKKYQEKKHNKKYHDIRDGKEIFKTELKITGKIPLWINGTYLRNGPGKYKFQNEEIWHFFDGLAYLVSFKFKNGKIFFSSKFLKTSKYYAFMKISNDNKKLLRGFAQNFEKYKTFLQSKDGQKVSTTNANINSKKINNKYIAFGETPLPVEFDINTLETKSIFDYDDILKKYEVWECADPKVDIDKTIL